MSMKVEIIRDYIVETTGKNNLIINEVVNFSNKTQGIVMKANENKAWIALFDQNINNPIEIGSTIEPTGKEFAIKISSDMRGHIINLFGEIMTPRNTNINKEQNVQEIDISKNEAQPVFRLARPIYTRDFVNEPLATGIAAVDWAIPVGKGQRELILGDRKTGKTSIALNAMLAQRRTKVISIYVAIGQKKTSILDLYNRLKEFDVVDQTIIVSASSEQIATKKWLAPYVGVTIAEYFQEKFGYDVLIIYDDLSKHADAYRELSLLMKSAPAREAYPGDIFYLHSKLLERAGKFNNNYGGGSITALPIIQTEAGDITSYIPTNVISITDGQIFTSKTLFNAGHRPAIDIPYSVSRVGSTAQSKALASLSSGLKLQVSQYQEAMKMTRLSGTVSEENKEIISSGKVLTDLLVQPEFDVLEVETGTLILSLFKKGYLNFYQESGEVTFVKQILNDFLAHDYVGQSLKELIQKHSLDGDKFELINTQIILPLLKHHIVLNYPESMKDEQFIKIFNDIRNDGIMYSNLRRKLKGDEYGIN